MNKKIALVSLFILISGAFSGHAQSYSLSGIIVDSEIVPLQFATVALLVPGDSTLAYYSISSAKGKFEIKNIKPGAYLLQAVFMGYETFYKTISFPGQETDFGSVILKAKALQLNETVISAERIPLLIKKDTIEYDAGAFKTKPDAVVEDLLKKLPGVEVDRAGNVKAQGEDVQKVLVDGKEFFGNDPKIATKNLPADAVDKVQVYDKKSEEAELTGVDDGIRSKTVNLLLKSNKKSAWLGEMNAGLGTDDHYQLAAKAYRFTRKNQFAVLGMLNNINQFGFSFQDYINFSGGFEGFAGTGSDVTFQINDDSNFSINFGQAEYGLISSGAGGLNYSYENNPEDRISLSYIANGTDRKLKQNTFTRNYVESGSFISSENLSERNKNYKHRLNVSGRKKVAARQNLFFSANGSLSDANLQGDLFSGSLINDTLINEFSSIKENQANGYNVNLSGTYLLKGEGLWKLLKVSGEIKASQKDQFSDWRNITSYVQPVSVSLENRYLDETEKGLNYSGALSVTRSIGKLAYLIPAIRIGINSEKLNKEQGIPMAENVLIDSLSSNLNTNYVWYRPALTYKINTQKTQFSISAQIESGLRSSSVSSVQQTDERIFYFIPQISWDREYRKGRRLSAGYDAEVINPQARQLYPIPFNSNSTQRILGNRDLFAEYSHGIHFHSMVFDQFSFTSLFTGLSAQYTRNKINWSRQVDDQLNQVLTPVNVRDDYRLRSNVEFGTPIRKLKVNISIDWMERWNQGINIVNKTENSITNFNHSLSFKLDNRKKEKWDVSIGAGVSYNQVRYSIGKELNNNYLSLNYFTDVSYTPNDNWHIGLSADVTQYKAESFQNELTIPLLKASLSRYLLRNGRIVLSIEAYDILDKNSGIERLAELNYLQEKQSNIIGRYFMLNVKFRLNKFSKKDSGNVEIDIK
ncbi:MAG: hypothetical protein EYC69_08215 [Bacteroidetes bacterium]|nr:MAG: hypothetical protein EYC69_08215 [Bacteroidota bacterium]